MNQRIFVTHDSIPPFLEKDSKILILGSFPSPASRRASFYYAFKNNRFFQVLSSLFQEEEPMSKEEREDFLRRHHIALYDVIESCTIIGASDNTIEDVKVADIAKIKKEYPSIQQVFTTGKKANDLYQKYIGKDNIPLPSPSSANASMSKDVLFMKYSIILSFLN